MKTKEGGDEEYCGTGPTERKGWQPGQLPMPRRARPLHALSVSATLNPCHRPRKGIDTVALEWQPPCLAFLSP